VSHKILKMLMFLVQGKVKSETGDPRGLNLTVVKLNDHPRDHIAAVAEATRVTACPAGQTWSGTGLVSLYCTSMYQRLAPFIKVVSNLSTEDLTNDRHAPLSEGTHSVNKTTPTKIQ
jgi:hypothetical protein